MGETGNFFQENARILLRIAEVLLGLGIASIIFSLLIKAIRNPKSFLRLLGGVAALGIIFGIAYALQGDDIPPQLLGYGLDASTVRLFGAMLITTYILGGLSILLLILGELKRFFT
ncbi:MAG: hypothetical protein GXO48_07220 [Chlorobi bacterium]|nr:hypothetical protein [Chlorobiota bacterium]